MLPAEVMVVTPGVTVSMPSPSFANRVPVTSTVISPLLRAVMALRPAMIVPSSVATSGPVPMVSKTASTLLPMELLMTVPADCVNVMPSRATMFAAIPLLAVRSPPTVTSAASRVVWMVSAVPDPPLVKVPEPAYVMRPSPVSHRASLAWSMLMKPLLVKVRSRSTPSVWSSRPKPPTATPGLTIPTTSSAIA